MNLLILHGGFRSLPALLLLSISALAAPAAALSPEYEAMLRAYASGDREHALSEVAAWPERRVREEVTALATTSGPWRPAQLRIALLLHTDCARRKRGEGSPTRDHESAAVHIARRLKDEPAQRAFVRRWYAAMAGLAQGENRWDEALDWAERGLRECPDSAELHLVVGSIEETVGALALTRLPGSVLSPVERQTRENLAALREARGHLERAYQSLHSAVAAEPSLTEARLRLGRVAWRLGKAAESRSALEGVLAREPAGRTAFLAHLFLGRLHEDAGPLEDAARAYEAALALDHRAQSARLALSHVRLRLGAAGAARREVEAAVGHAGLRPEPEPFWLYPWGPSVGVEERLEALRREASS